MHAFRSYINFEDCIYLRQIQTVKTTLSDLSGISATVYRSQAGNAGRARWHVTLILSFGRAESGVGGPQALWAPEPLDTLGGDARPPPKTPLAGEFA